MEPKSTGKKPVYPWWKFLKNIMMTEPFSKISNTWITENNFKDIWDLPKTNKTNIITICTTTINITLNTTNIKFKTKIITTTPSLLNNKVDTTNNTTTPKDKTSITIKKETEMVIIKKMEVTITNKTTTKTIIATKMDPDSTNPKKINNLKFNNNNNLKLNNPNKPNNNNPKTEWIEFTNYITFSFLSYY